MTKFGVVISTYQRPDGRTPEYISRAIKSVLSQVHTDWKIYLIGDKYKDNGEFEKFRDMIPSDKVVAINLPVAIERERYPEGGINLWHCAGASATNIGIELSVGQGYDYICKLDHDDHWAPTHLSLLNKAIDQTKADFLFTKSTYWNQSKPHGNFQGEFIQMHPQPKNVINSSTCVNYKKILLRRADPYYQFGEQFPGDAFFYIRLKPLIDSGEVKSIFVNKLTCFHEEEGYAQRLNQSDIKNI
jgi:glycosyltransferase involved in cell wall biosynthesis